MTSTYLFAAPPFTPYAPNETSDPACAPGDPNCFVQLADNDNQTLSSSGNSLSISGGNSINLGSILTANDDQTLTISGSILSIANGNSILLPSGSSGSQTLSISGSTLSISGGNSIAIPGAITSLNGQNTATQTIVAGNTGSDFNISSSAGTHTFNIPDASATARGLVTTLAQSFAGAKSFLSDLIVNGNTTLGDVAADTLTINGTAVSIPNKLNFDANTFYIDAATNRVGIGTASPGTPLYIASTAAYITIQDTDTAIGSALASGLFMRDSNGISAAYVGFGGSPAFDIANMSNTPIRFYTNGAEVVRITETGLV